MASPSAGSASLAQAARRLVSFPVLMGVLLIGVALIGVRARLPDPDTWWHIAVGQQILATHSWPSSDSYSFTAAGGHWIAYEWLGEIAMALAAHAGLVGLAALLMGLVAVVTGLLYHYAYLRSGNAKAACLATGILLPVGAAVFSLRPQMLGYSFLLLTLVCLEHFRQGRTRWLWVLPPLFLVWVNTHGTFAFGLVLIGLEWASGLVSFRIGGLTAERWTEKQRLQLSVTFLLCLIAVCVTPYGSELAAYPVQMATAQPVNIASIQEWQPVSFGLALGKYLLGVLLLLFLGHVVFPLKYRLQELAMLLFGVYAACVHVRFILIFVMFLAPILAGILARWIRPYDPARDRYFLNLAVILLAVVSLARFFPGRAELGRVVAKDYPVGAVEYLRQHPQPTRMFNEYGYGGYLIWQLGPERKVFIDGRADLYEYSGVLTDYLRIANLDRDALSLLNKYSVQSCLVDRASPLATLLSVSPGWKQVYSDSLSAIFVRPSGTTDSGN